MKKQRVKPGDILKVAIENDVHTYCRVLNDADVAFYDCRSTEDVGDLEKIIASKIIFIIIVDKPVLSNGQWPRAGYIPLGIDLQKNPAKFIKEAGEEKYEIYDNGIIRSATKDECIGLEVLASWAKEHVEERLKSYYNGGRSILMDVYGPLKI